MIDLGRDFVDVFTIGINRTKLDVGVTSHLNSSVQILLAAGPGSPLFVVFTGALGGEVTLHGLAS